MSFNYIIDEEMYELDEEATLQVTKKYLKFFSKNYYMIHQQFTVSDEIDVMDYMSYSKSIIQPHRNPSINLHSAKILNAIEKKDKEELKMRNYLLQKKELCRRILQAIMSLPDVERKLMISRHISNITMETIANQHPEYSISSLYRMYKQACIHMAQMLEIEIYQKKHV